MRELFILFGLGISSLCAQGAELIFFGGEILTVNDEAPTAEAVAVADGKILFVGSQQGAFGYKTDQTELIDLRGAALLPGFIDAHTHMIMEALMQTGVDVSPFRCKRIGQVIRVLKHAAKKGPVLAFGYDPTLMTKPARSRVERDAGSCHR